MRLFPLMAMAAAMICVCTGCANVVRPYDDTEDRVDRTELGVKRTVLFTPDPPNSVDFTATAATVNKQQVKRYQVFIHGEIVTPYEGWREIYEIPTGIVLIPVSLCSHIISVFTFGVYPFSFSNAVTDLAYSGVNPALNWESESRTEKQPLTSTEKLIDEQEEDKITPIQNATILVETGDFNRKFTADKFGNVALKFVALERDNSLFRGDRVFLFTVDNDTKVTRQLLISRDFANHLLRARAAIMRYESAPSGRNLSRAVKTLEEMKFTGLAYLLEKRELEKNRNNSAFLEEFNNVSLE